MLGSPPNGKGIRYDRQSIKSGNPLGLVRRNRNLCQRMCSNGSLTLLAPPLSEPHARSAWGFFVPKSSDFMIVPTHVSGKRMADVKKLKCRVGLCKYYNAAFLRVVSNVIL